MRKTCAFLASAILVSGCDDETLRILAGAGLADAPSRPGAHASPPGRAPATPAPVVARRAPLDLAGQTWVADQPNTWKVEGDRLIAPAEGIGAVLFYTPPLGDTYDLRFREPRTTVTGDVTVMWQLDRTAGAPGKYGQAVTTGEMKLMLKVSGLCEVWRDNKVAVSRMVTGPRIWEIKVEGNHSRVTLNGEPFAEFDHVPGYHPAPFLMLESHATKPGVMQLEGVQVTSNAPGPRYAVLRQWSLEGRNLGVDRLNLVYASDFSTLPRPDRLDTLPTQFEHVVALGGYPLHPNAALLWARADQFPGGHHTSKRGIFLAPGLCDANYVAAHEIAHGYRAAGSQKAHPKEHWLIEGFASYLGTASHHRALGRPVWKGSTAKAWSYDPPLSETDEQTRAKGFDVGIKHYTKGQIFLQVLSAYTSPEDLTAVFTSLKDTTELSGDIFVKRLETRTGKDLGFLRPGWLFPGPYKGVSPKDAIDTDKDGLIDFQEIAWGTNPASKDSDADGASDFAEKVAGTDPTVAASSSALNGFAPNLGVETLPDVETEEATPFEEGEIPEEEADL